MVKQALTLRDLQPESTRVCGSHDSARRRFASPRPRLDLEGCCPSVRPRHTQRRCRRCRNMLPTATETIERSDTPALLSPDPDHGTEMRPGQLACLRGAVPGPRRRLVARETSGNRTGTRTSGASPTAKRARVRSPAVLRPCFAKGTDLAQPGTAVSTVRRSRSCIWNPRACPLERLRAHVRGMKRGR